MRKGSSIPKYRRQKRARHSDLAFVDLGGKRVYLGEYGSRQSRRDYDRRIQEWMAGQHCPRIDESSLTIVELIERYHHFAAEYYRKPDGSTSSELKNVRLALRPVRGAPRHNLWDFRARTNAILPQPRDFGNRVD